MYSFEIQWDTYYIFKNKIPLYKSNAKISHIKPKQTETHKTNKINDIGSVYILQIVCFRLIPFGFFVVFLLHGKNL